MTINDIDRIPVSQHHIVFAAGTAKFSAKVADGHTNSDATPRQQL